MLPEIGLDVAGGYQCDIMARENMNGMAYQERGRRILSYTGQKVVVDPKGQPWVIGEIPVKKFPPMFGMNTALAFEGIITNTGSMVTKQQT